MSLSPSDEQELVRLRHTGKERFNRNMKKLGEFFFDLFFSLSLSPLLTLSSGVLFSAELPELKKVGFALLALCISSKKERKPSTAAAMRSTRSSMRAAALPLIVALLASSASAASAPRRLSSPSSSSSTQHSSSSASNSVKTLKCEDEGKPVSHLFGRSAPPPQKSCSSVGVVLANERARFSFEVARGRTVACELNALSGDADLEVSPPAHEGGPGPKSSREVREENG